MPEAQITNPRGAFYGDLIADFSDLTDPQCLALYPRRIDTFRCNDTVAIYNAVGLVAPTTTVPLSVELLDVSDAFDQLVFAGVAQEAGTAGSNIDVCSYGATPVTVDTSDPVFGDVAVPSATDGLLATGGTLGGTWDASDVAGTGLGVFLGVEDASDIAPLWLKNVGF